MQKEKKLISFVIPVFNEEQNIPLCYAEMKKFAEQLPAYHFEFLFTNNHSQDRSLEIIKTLRQGDQRVRYLSYSKNFGYQHSILQGLLHAQGDAAVILDCDLQDPLSVVSDFINYWEQDYQVVYGVRIKRAEGKFITALRKAFYYLINKISDEPLPLDAGDFRLIDRKIINELHKVSEDKPYLRAIIATMGFNQRGVPYERLGRQFGESKFPFKEMLRLSMHGIFNHSNLPLRLASYFGMLITFVSILGMVIYLACYFLLGSSWPKGYASIILLIIFGIGLNALFLGILGEYINRIYVLLRKSELRAIIQESSETAR